MATDDTIAFSIHLCVSMHQFFLKNRFRACVPAIIASIMAKFEQIV